MAHVLVTGAGGFVGRAVVRHLRATGVDVRAGTRGGGVVLDAPAWDPAGARFTRVLHAPAGTPIVPSASTPGFVVSTATSIWRRDTCFTDASPFDPAFGASGGEDLDLFLRLERRGRRFVWCPGAGVQETIPAGRTAWRYQLLRAYSGAQVYTAAAVRHSGGPGRHHGARHGAGDGRAIAGSARNVARARPGRRFYARKRCREADLVAQAPAISHRKTMIAATANGSHHYAPGLTVSLVLAN